MSTAADVAPNEYGAENPEVRSEYPEHSHRHYLLVALALAIITGLEVMVSYVHIGPFFMPVLLILMAIKFVMVVLEFMHLRHDHKIFHYLFWSGLLLAVLVYIAYLATFKFFLPA
ncbi:MAG: cytochrome C oxidase subunit IV family protein [Thermomicrobium sp.]|nr:cytochrome C oxidase subunit IV family protein [Thermomicrobium sp.]